MGGRKRKHLQGNKVPEMFQAQLDALTIPQRAAVEALEGPVLVVAGPGTGKTHVLTLRVAALVSFTDTPADAILVLTHTDAAALEVRARLVRLMGSRGYQPTVATYHSFAAQVLQEAGSGEAMLVSELEQRRIVRDFLKHEERGKPLSSPHEEVMRRQVETLLALISGLKREGWSVAQYEQWLAEAYLPRTTDAQRHARAQATLACYAAYERALQERGVRDYDDLLVEAVRLLEQDEDLRRNIQERYLSALADEHQDANALQTRLLELVVEVPWHRAPNVFVVGDPEQAIYRFHGASSENFRRAERRWQPKRIVLTHSFRSHANIVEATQRFLATAEGHEAHGLVAAALHAHDKADTPPAMVVRCEGTAEDEVQWVAHEVATLITSGTAPASIAILARTRQTLEEVARALQAQEVPSIIVGRGVRPDDHPAVRLFLAFLRATAQPEESWVALTEAVWGPWIGVSPTVTARFVQLLRRFRHPQRAIAILKDEGVKPQLLRPIERLIDLVASAQTHAHALPADEAIAWLAQRSGFLSYAATHPEVYHHFETIITEARDNDGKRGEHIPSLAEVVEAVHDRLALGSARDVPAPTGVDAVQLLTVHGAKGREFDTVFLIRADERSWERRRVPVGLPVPPVGTLESPQGFERVVDERRLFFVGLTRARRQLVVTHPTHTEEGKPRPPSRFVEELVEAGVPERRIPHQEIRSMFHTTKPPARRQRLTPLMRYLHQRLLHQPLSVTAINHFVTSPWAFIVRSLLRIPEGTTPALHYGATIDAVVSEYVQSLARGEELTQEELLALFAAQWNNSVVALQDPAAHHLYSTQGREDLARWYQRWASWAHTVRLQPKWKLSVPYPLSSGTILTLTGEIDAWYEAAPFEVVVVDFKTGRPALRPSDFKEEKKANYLRQLAFYKLLIEVASGGKRRVNRGILQYFADSGTKKWGVAPQYEHLLTAQDRQTMEEWVATIGDTILSGSFLDYPIDVRASYAGVATVVREALRA